MTAAWSDITIAVYRKDKHVGYDGLGRPRWVLGYDENDPTVGGRVCNVFTDVGDGMCRLPRGHDGAHAPFSAELVVSSGVYVEVILPCPDCADTGTVEGLPCRSCWGWRVNA